MIAHLAASTLVALAAVAMGMALRGRGGAWRYALLLAAILRFAAPTPWLAAAGARLAPYAHPRAARPAAVDRLADLLLFGDAQLRGVAVRTDASVQGGVNPYLFLWAAGFGLCLSIWIRGLLRPIPAVREATAEEAAALECARRAFGSGVAAELRIAAAEQAPGVRGLWRSSIVLPDGLSEQLSAAELEAVLLHELAHVRRRDNLTAALAHLVVCAFWFYPPIWWLERRMLCDRETACDEMVLALGAGAEEYLSGLVKVCRMSFAAAGYAGAGGSNFQIRMERIMSADFQRSSSSALRACAAALVALAVMVPVGGAFLKAQQSMPGLQTATKAVIETPADGQIQAGKAMLKAGNPAGAEEAFRMARDFDPKNEQALMGLVEALIAQGRTDAAIELLKREVAEYGSRADLHLALGNTAVRAGKYDLALTEFQTVLAIIDPNSAGAGDIHMRMGETYRRMGNLDAAVAELRLAKNLMPNGTVISTLGICLESAGHWEEAEKEYREAVRIDPNNAVVLNNLAYLLSEHDGNIDLAVTFARRSAQLLPDSSEVRDTLGTIYLAKGMTDAALQVFREMLRKSPAHAEHLALRLAEKGQRDAVLADLTGALAGGHSQADNEAIAEILRKLK